MKKITIADIAKMASVSTATVSRVLNQPHLVSKETEKKVRDIVEKYNYLPNIMARSLSKKSTDTIAIMIPEINNEFFGRLLAGISEETDKHNLFWLSFNTDNDYNKEVRALNDIVGQYVKGIIYSPSLFYKEKAQEDDIIKRLKDMDVPVVIVDRKLTRQVFDGVYFDDEQATYEATLSLINSGHKRIGFVSSMKDGSNKLERERGIKRALTEHGLVLENDNIIFGDYLLEKSYQAVKERFTKPNPPSAFILPNNNTSLGFFKAINELNLKLNEDVFCVAGDPIPALNCIGMSYNYIDRDPIILGMRVMDRLVERINNPSLELEEIYIRTKVVFDN
ncbi:MAG TPA: LacI family DNA-binding transcriptional regulator [Dysgonamonadaceae bacterium]|nr:LacI family DNA-binding transcriptional regulator [Dysgonamonadaceae bacterium]